MTNACVVLHNIVNSARLPVPELTLQQEQYEASMQVQFLNLIVIHTHMFIVKCKSLTATKPNTIFFLYA